MTSRESRNQLLKEDEDSSSSTSFTLPSPGVASPTICEDPPKAAAAAAARDKIGVRATRPRGGLSLNAMMEIYLMTIWETLTYHIWAFWAGRSIGFILRSHVAPFKLLPPLLQQVLLGGLSLNIWVHYLSSGHPKEIELALLRPLRSRQQISLPLILQMCGVITGLFSFTYLWSFLQSVSNQISPSWNLVFSAPKLPLPRSAISGEIISLNTLDIETAGTLLTEYVLSFFHYYGIGLATLLRPKGARGLLTFRLFVSPMLAAIGAKGPTGQPSLNSSVALISAIKNQSLGAVWLAVMDILALITVITFPRMMRSVTTKIHNSMLQMASYAKCTDRPRTFKKSQDKTVYAKKSD